MSVSRFFKRKSQSNEDILKELSKIEILLKKNDDVNTAHEAKRIEYVKQERLQNEAEMNKIWPDLSRLGKTVNENWHTIEKLINAFIRKHLPNFKSSRKSPTQTQRVKEIKDQMTPDSSNRSPESFQSKPANAAYLCSMRQMLEDPQFHTTSTDIQRMRTCLIAIV